MRRNAVCLCTSAVMTLACGCSMFGPKSAATDPNLDFADAYFPPVQESSISGDTYPAYGSAVAVETSYDEPESLDSSAEPNIHFVVKKDTLYGLARMYYGDQRRWKEIYAANRPVIGDPNKIRVGQRLVIP